MRGRSGCSAWTRRTAARLSRAAAWGWLGGGLWLAAVPATADSLRELAAAGLSFSSPPGVAVASEDVAIGLREIVARYRVENRGTQPAVLTMALHLPDIDVSDPDATYAIPLGAAANYMGSVVTVDGKPADVAVRQTAQVNGREITARLREAKLPLLPGSDFQSRLAAVPPALLRRLIEDGILVSNGSRPDGPVLLVPSWRVTATGAGKRQIGAGQALTVEMRSMTSLGSSPDTVLRKALRQEADLSAEVDALRKTFCIEDSFIGGVDRIAGDAADNAADLAERRIAFDPAPSPTLTAEALHLSIDKGRPDNLISTCLDNLRKTGPTGFETTAAAPPPHDVKLLIITARQGPKPPASAPPPDPGQAGIEVPPQVPAEGN